MSPVLELSAPPRPRAGKPKAAAKGRPAARRKVWSGARKRLAVSPLQMTLPGIGTKAL